MKRPASITVREWRAVRRIVRRAAREQRRYDDLREALGAVALAARVSALSLGVMALRWRTIAPALRDLRREALP